jgi:ABC-type polysaccharide/polyol phosphate export permease
MLKKIMSKFLLFKISLQNLIVDYHHSKISYLWIPLSFMILVFAKGFFLGDILGIDSNFILYLCIGLWIWNYISLAVPSYGNSLFNNRLILNININPHQVLHILYFRLLITFFLNLVVLAVFLLFFTIQFNILAFLLGSLTLIILVHQVGKLLSIISLYYRDITQFINSMMIILFFLSPIFWYPQQLSVNKLYLLQFNPVYHILNVFRDAIMKGTFNTQGFIIMTSLIVIVFIVNYLFTNKQISNCATKI